MYAFGLKSRDSYPERFALLGPVGLEKPVPDAWGYEYIFNPVDDQADFQTCVAHSIKGLLEAIVRKRTGESIAVSWRGIYALTKHLFEQDDLADDGLVIEDALTAIEQYGYPLESIISDANVTESNLLDPIDLESLVHAHSIVKFNRVAISSDTLARALCAHGPIVSGFNWPEAWMLGPDANGFLPPFDGPVAGGHCVDITDFKMVGHLRYFAIRNSWGKAWGVNGVAWFSEYSIPAITNAYTAVIP